jgi:hypothetical protein
VYDAALTLEVLAGADPADATSAAAPVPEYTAALTGDVRGVRIGVPRSLLEQGVDDDVSRALTAALDTLRARGIREVRGDLVGDGSYFEPLTVNLSRGAVTRVEWDEVPGAVNYDVVRGDLSALRVMGSDVNLGTVTCIESDSTDTTTAGREDSVVPAPGKAFFYLIQFNDGLQDSSYGSMSVGRARVVSGGNCQ